MAFIVVAVGAGGVSSYLLWRKLRRRKYRIAVLGARWSGKSTLINSWRGEWVGDEHDPGRTHAPKVYEKTKLTSEGLRLTFTHVMDLSGASAAWPQWESRAMESRYVLYLVDARALSGELSEIEGRNWYRLEDDAELLGTWLKQGEAELCVLVVTHTDEDARLTQFGVTEYRELIATQVDPLVLRLGGPRRTRTVVGSLKTREGAEMLTGLITNEIVGYEKSKPKA